MDVPTEECRQLLDEIEGLALYMGIAESGRLNTLNPPSQTLEHYHRLLPYAVALGLEKAWGARFASVLETSVGSLEVVSPAIADSLSSEASHCASSAESHASGESSFSGGGGAGSGGGGGGGGGC